MFVNSHPDAPEAKRVRPFKLPAEPTPFMKEFEAGAFDEPSAAEIGACERREEEARRQVEREPAMPLAKAYQTAADESLGEVGPPEESEPAQVIRWHQFAREALEAALPRAREFVRPGFDTIPP